MAVPPACLQVFMKPTLRPALPTSVGLSDCPDAHQQIGRFVENNDLQRRDILSLRTLIAVAVNLRWITARCRTPRRHWPPVQSQLRRPR